MPSTSPTSPFGPRARELAPKPSAVREYMSYHRSRLIETMETRGAGGVVLARKYSDVADELIRKLFAEARSEADQSPLLLGAVGGYGRQLLALGSDLDLCFVSGERTEVVAPTVEAMLYPLWDAGINVGHQIVHPSDVVADAQADLKMATELLDFRPLAGDVSLMQAVRRRLTDSIFSELKIATFIAQLEARGAQRHEKFGDSVYLLEPDIKNGTGGLRDLDSALWAARARFGTSDLQHLVELGVITEQSRRDVERAHDFLWTVRNQLHRIVGRKADRLTFTEQERVAHALGYGSHVDLAAPKLQQTGEMVEAFMSDYYRHARLIAQTRARILGHAKRRPSANRPAAVLLGGGLVECEGRVGLAEPGELDQEPVLALRVYGAAVASDRGVLSQTRDAIACATAEPRFCERLRDSKETAELFVALVCACRSVAFASGSVLTELHDVGLLLAMIPEFAPVVGRVHHDLYHVYTVDVHSIAAVDRLRALVRGELARRLPLASRLAAEAGRQRVVFLATLLHDIGKAIGGRNHAQRGAEMARTILGRLGFTPDEIDDAAHLILHHLTMYMVAIRRDLGDPRTIAEFLRDVRGREGLRELYLLTVADVSTTSAVAMTKWKRSMLDELFRASDASVAGARPDPTDRVSRVRAQARALWPTRATLDAFDHFLKSMPERYFLSNTAEDVVAHAEVALHRREGSVALSVVPSSHDGVLGLCVVAEGRSEADLCVVAGDRPGLLASIAAAISANRFDIQGAQVNSRPLPDGAYQAVDLFWVRGASHEDSINDRLTKLERDLDAVIRGAMAPRALLKDREPPYSQSLPTPGVSTEVVFDHHASEQYTVIEVLTEDRSALLFTLATTLHELGISIGVAKITTEGRRAIDVFYAAELDGSKIAPGARSDEVRAALLSALGGDES